MTVTYRLQLRYAGLLEVCRIRQAGYPSRIPLTDFYRAYKVTACVVNVYTCAGSTPPGLLTYVCDPVVCVRF